MSAGPGRRPARRQRQRVRHAQGAQRLRCQPARPGEPDRRARALLGPDGRQAGLQRGRSARRQPRRGQRGHRRRGGWVVRRTGRVQRQRRQVLHAHAGRRGQRAGAEAQRAARLAVARPANLRGAGRGVRDAPGTPETMQQPRAAPDGTGQQDQGTAMCGRLAERLQRRAARQQERREGRVGRGALAERRWARDGRASCALAGRTLAGRGCQQAHPCGAG